MYCIMPLTRSQQGEGQGIKDEINGKSSEMEKSSSKLPVETAEIQPVNNLKMSSHLEQQTSEILSSENE